MNTPNKINMKYVSKKEVIEAIRWDGTNLKELVEFCPDIIDLGCDSSNTPPTSWPIQIGHPGDTDYSGAANLGDYIVRDKGDYCIIPEWIFIKHYVFDETPEDQGREKAIGFAEWIVKEDYKTGALNEHWFKWNGIECEEIPYTTSELYDIYEKTLII